MKGERHVGDGWVMLGNHDCIVDVDDSPVVVDVDGKDENREAEKVHSLHEPANGLLPCSKDRCMRRCVRIWQLTCSTICRANTVMHHALIDLHQLTTWRWFAPWGSF